MIVLAVLLLLAVALVVLFVVVTGLTPTVQLEWSQISTSVTLTALALFLLGAATLLVAEAGLALLLRGNRRNWERRRELSRLRRVEAERARQDVPARETSPGGSSTTPPAPAGRGRSEDRPTGTTTSSPPGPATGSTKGSTKGTGDGATRDGSSRS